MHEKSVQHKIGHFSPQCCSRQVSAVTEKGELKDSYNEDQFLGAVISDSLTQWNETIEINSKQVQIKVQK